MNQQHPNGTVFHQKDGDYYWKITGTYQALWVAKKRSHYSVINCTEKGEEQKEKNCFFMDVIDAALEDPKNKNFSLVAFFDVSGEINDKIIKKQRRLSFLKSQIVSFQKEVDGLEEEIEEC